MAELVVGTNVLKFPGLDVGLAEFEMCHLTHLCVSLAQMLSLRPKLWDMKLRMLNLLVTEVL